MTRLLAAALLLTVSASAWGQTIYDPSSPDVSEQPAVALRAGVDPDYWWLEPEAAARLRSLQERAPVIVIQVEGGDVKVLPLDRRALRELNVNGADQGRPAKEQTPLYFRMQEQLRGDDSPEITDPNTRDLSVEPEEEGGHIMIFPKKGDPAAPAQQPGEPSDNRNPGVL